MQILLTVAYDGTNYAGWQRQENAVAVQEIVENTLAELLGCPVVVRAASRTDAGVHALGQRVAFFADGLKVPLDKLPVVLSGMLPADISVLAAQVVADDFNPRFNPVAKTYAYRIHSAPCPNPLLLRYAAHVPQELNLAKMQKAAQAFVGRHDFAAFCAAGSSAKTTVREVYSCQVDFADDVYTLTIRGNAFLYNMVRIVAGTVVYAGLGKVDDVPGIIASLDRAQAGKTMPPQGLTLLRVEY
ncbi:MAG: tRNA pseudouridine(38-40) synthase TruA [Defluviitaleaceae bacterium]|nr:tRNA pseudouridine(38-40) synthase TruA [Defluviitaleaceae bacterium]